MSAPRAADAAYYEQDELWGAEHIENAEHLRMRYDAIVSLLPDSVRHVVEFGSGDGRVLEHLASARPTLEGCIGIDRSLAALAHQRAVGIAATIEEVPLASRSAEAVLCCEVLEHLDHEGFGRARAELSRVAERWVLVTVPNRENRRRASVTCPACDCRYSPIRHLRSFSPGSLADLVPGFRMVTVQEAGPRVVLYPRVLRSTLETIGLVHRSGAPVCPQCGAGFGSAQNAAERASGGLRTTSARVRRLVPKSRRRYWLCALYERVDDPSTGVRATST